MSDELEDLFVDGSEMDRKLAAEILAPFIRIDKNTCKIKPLEKWNGLSVKVKLLIYLLARKAMIAYGLAIDEEAASSTEITNNTGVAGSTARPGLRELFDDKIVAQTKKRKYYVPTYAIEKVKGIIVIN